MTKLNDSDIEGEKSNSSFVSTSTDCSDSVINSKILEEEERLTYENEAVAQSSMLYCESLAKERDADKIKKNSVAYQVKSDEELARVWDESFKQNDEELAQQLEQSLKDDEELARQTEAELKAMRYRKLMHLLDNSKMYSIILKDRIKEEFNIRNSGNLREKKNSNSQGKKKPNTEYNLGDILSEENINEKMAANDGKLQQVIEEDYFKETRITSMGFTVSHKQPVLLEGAVMRDYQLKGLEWLKILFSNGVNGVLADEMGLGKTIQVISFICYMIEQNIKGPFLIVAPLSTISNWISEFKRFAPKVPIMLYHGTVGERNELLPEIFTLTEVLDKTVHKVVITSYQVPLRDKAKLKKITWYYLIVDEGQRIKNHNSLLARTLKEFNTIGRLIVTGTPLQNNLSELWSLLNFLLPEVFNALDVFESWFDIKEIESKGANFMAEKFNVDIVTILQEILAPFLLRREKKDVDMNLPPKKEILIYCSLTTHQKTLYESILDRSIELLLKPKENVEELDFLPKRKCFLNSPYGKKKSEPLKEKKQKNSPPKRRREEKKVKEEEKEEERFITKLILQNPQMLLRKAVNHPYLIQYPLEVGTENLRIDEELVTQSGKMLVLDAILAKLKGRGHKVIIFSYFKIVLDILEDYASLRSYKYCRLDGDQSGVHRSEEILQFNTNPEIFLFFATMRAGGLGINLIAADTVIFYDSDWNPQVNLQSQDRCHRIGQTKPVVIYRLCVKGTIDEKIIERGNAKRKLEKLILQKGKYAMNSQYSKKLNAMDLQELKSLLESTDHDVVINSNGFVLSDEVLNTLLDRSDMETCEKESKNRDNKMVFTVLS